MGILFPEGIYEDSISICVTIEDNSNKSNRIVIRGWNTGSSYRILKAYQR